MIRIRTKLLAASGIVSFLVVLYILSNVDHGYTLRPTIRKIRLRRGEVHPLAKLISEARQKHSDYLSSRSKTFSQFLENYAIHNPHHPTPPKGIEDWYSLAVRLKTCNLDRFDTIRDGLLPFRAMSPREFRARTRELAGKHSIGLVRFRNGRVVRWTEMNRTREEVIEEVEARGEEWEEGKPGDDDPVDFRGDRGHNQYERQVMERIFVTLEEEYGVKGLPDFDFYVNSIDQPRIIMDWKETDALVQLAKKGKVRPPPPTVPKLKFTEFKETHAGTFFEILRTSCPPSSPSHSVPITPHPGSNPIISKTYTSTFSTPLGSFLSDPSAELDWCTQPDMKDLHSGLIRPQSHGIAIGIWPLGGQSTIKGYADILIPPWYYWDDAHRYRPEMDYEWRSKRDKIFWRGTLTGGYSIADEWRGWQRARIVSLTNTPLNTTTIPNEEVTFSPSSSDDDDNPNHLSTMSIPRTLLNRAYTDIALTSVDHGRGTPQSLTSQAMEPTFRFTPFQPYTVLFSNKMTVDFDGTIYSGRFLPLLSSKSAVVKSRLFVEAMQDYLIPWFHYIPLSLRYIELYDILSYFFGGSPIIRASLSSEDQREKLTEVQLRLLKGFRPREEELREIAMNGAGWAEKCARKEDIALYAYRLALELGRLWNDGREDGRWDYRPT